MLRIVALDSPIAVTAPVRARHERDVRRLDGDVGPGADGDTNVCPSQRGSAVHAVPHHTDAAARGSQLSADLPRHGEPGRYLIMQPSVLEQPEGLWSASPQPRQAGRRRGPGALPAAAPGRSPGAPPTDPPRDRPPALLRRDPQRGLLTFSLCQPHTNASVTGQHVKRPVTHRPSDPKRFRPHASAGRR